MDHPRLTRALQGGDALPAEGAVLVLLPPGHAAMPPVPRDRTVVVQGFRPAHDALSAAGWQVVPDAEAAGASFAAALALVPRTRAAAQAAVAEAVARCLPGAPIWVDGQKTDGIEPLIRDLGARVALSDALAKAHGKTVCFARPKADDFTDWRAADLMPAPGFVTRPGVFSAEHVDAGSALLAAALPAALGARVADLGAGWGWLSAQILARADVKELHLVEADHAALACARRNISAPQAAFHWADATRFTPSRPLDAVVMNPPFHTGRAADPSLGIAFIAAAARMLAPQGILYMVANRHLPYEAALAQHFREVAEFGGDGGFKLLRGARPLGKPRPGR